MVYQQHHTSVVVIIGRDIIIASILHPPFSPFWFPPISDSLSLPLVLYGYSYAHYTPCAPEIHTPCYLLGVCTSFLPSFRQGRNTSIRHVPHAASVGWHLVRERTCVLQERMSGIWTVTRLDLPATVLELVHIICTLSNLVAPTSCWTTKLSVVL